MTENEKTLYAAELTAKLNQARILLKCWSTINRAASVALELYQEGDPEAVGVIEFLTTAIAISGQKNALVTQYIDRWQPEVDDVVRELTGGNDV